MSTTAQASETSIPTLQQVQARWCQRDWQSLSQIDVATIKRSDHRAKLALCAAVGLAKQGQGTDALQAVQRALDWGIDPQVPAYLASCGVLKALNRPMAMATEPGLQRAARVLQRSAAMGATLSADSDWWLQSPAEIPSAKPQAPEDYRQSPRFSAEAYAYYCSLGKGDQPPSFYQIDSKSLPRSGLHYLKQTLDRLLPNHFSFCEWYQEPGCCQRMPCSLTAYAESAQHQHQLKVRLLKSHDFELDDPAYPVTPSLSRLILVRDPLFVLTSWFELHQMQQHHALLKAHAISMAKIYLLHESEVTRMALRLIDEAYNPIDPDALSQWLKQRGRYIGGFLRRWAYPAVDNPDLGWRLVPYEGISAYLVELLTPLRDRLTPEARLSVDGFLQHSNEQFHPRSDPFELKSRKITEDVRKHAALFQETAREITESREYQAMLSRLASGSQ